MKFRKVLETDVGLSTRCGRCATILPDETMSYCPICGALFSQVPPTNDYVDLVQRRITQSLARSRMRTISLSALFVALFFVCFGAINVLMDGLYVRASISQFREVRFHFYDFEGIPKLPLIQKRQAVAIGLQAFEDHFHIPIKNVSIREDSAPDFLQKSFAQSQQLLTKDHVDPMSLPISNMSYWERTVFPAAVRRWQNDPDQVLDVVVTNLPVHTDVAVSQDIETRHLGGAGLVSGLANPGMAIISTYRIHNDNPDLILDRPPTQNDAEKARFVGEFTIAHELGHALLGLGDVILSPEDYQNIHPAQPVLRSPTSIGARGISSGPDYRQCLMHTDSGGGFLAWEFLRKRNLGEPSNCHAYDGVVEAFRMHFESIALLKAGLREQAALTHAQAIELASQPTEGWVARSWQRDNYLFSSVFNRWIYGMFMFQSKHDQL